MPGHQTLEFQGCRFAYRIEGSGPPMVMIQGVGAYGLGLNPVVQILRKDFTCLIFDNRGIGASQPAGMPITVEQMAADTLALMDNAGLASAHIVGHSLGGLTAMQIALMAKRRVRSLSLLCTFARGADATRLTPGLLWIAVRIRFAPRPWRRDAFMELVLPPGQPFSDEIAAHISAVLGHDIAEMPPIAGRQVDAMRRHNMTRRLHELAGIPTLVVNGENDIVARPSSGRAIAAGVPGSRYVEIPGASHAFPILQAERCAALVLENLTAAESRMAHTARP